MAAKIALITGANSGIGYQIAQHLATSPEPYTVILAGRNPTRITQAISTLQSSTPNLNKDTTLHPLTLDVDSTESITKAAESVTSDFKVLDILINNAGIQPTHESLADQFAAAFRTNVTGPVLVSQAFRPLLLKSKATPAPYSLYIGSSVSSLALVTDPKSHYHSTNCGTTPYRSSKLALNMIAMHEQLEVADTPLRVRIMCPGFVVSNIRGESEQERSGNGYAGDPANSAKLALSVLRGEREADAQYMIEGPGIVPW